MAHISVIVPCYNGEAVLERCISSLLAQTLPLQEIIIVNDGSTDGSAALAQSFADRYPAVKVISKENQGLPQARKTGVETAQGEYIGFLDCDDWVEPETYRSLYEMSMAEDADIAVGGFSRCFADGTKKTEPQMFADGTVLDVKQALHALHMRRDVFPYMWNKLYRRCLFENVDFPHGNFIGEDYVTLLQILKNVKRIAVVKAGLFNYWQGSNSMCRTVFKSAHYLAYSHYREAIRDVEATYPEMKNDAHCYVAVEYLSFVLAMKRGKNYDMGMLREIQEFIRKNLLSMLQNRDFSLFYKMCMLTFSMDYRLFTTIYSLLQS